MPFRPISPLVPLAAGLLISAAALRPAAAQSAAESIGAQLQMVALSAPYREAADRFIAHASAGDLPGTQAMLSRALVERSGAAGVRRALEGQILPFFAQGGETGRSVTVAQTTDANGQRGYAFYLWLLPRDGSRARPYSVYVVLEQGSLVVANVVPDRHVEGRHR